MADLDELATRLRRTPTIPHGFVQAGATLTAEPFLGLGKIQFLAGKTAAFFDEIFGESAPAAGHGLPLGDITVSWLAPDEWLLTGPEGAVLAALERADIAGDSGLATDLSDARASFQLSGQGARDRLAAHTPLDISDAAMAVGRVARAPLGDTGMFIARLPDTAGQPTFRIIVDQTMAAYAVRMLAGPATTSGAPS
jgi:sarcosine oxidase subunit gamma